MDPEYRVINTQTTVTHIENQLNMLHKEGYELAGTTADRLILRKAVIDDEADRSEETCSENK